MHHAIVGRNEFESVHYMNPQELRTRLESELHGKITSAEWAFLGDVGLLSEYESGLSDWPEFRRGVEDNLTKIRRYRENDRREQVGLLLEEPDEESDEHGADHQQEPVPVDIEDSTLARYYALDALNNLRSGGSAPARATMTGTLLPRGGEDGTVSQWVYVIAAELWMPAEEVARSFRAMQRTLMVEPAQPKTRARAFNVARFVWEQEMAYGKRPTWPEMCKRWNNACKRWNDARPDDVPRARPFEDWRDFHKNFVRGEKATVPRYKATDEEITKQVKEASNRGGTVAFDLWVHQVLAATVQQDPDAR